MSKDTQHIVGAWMIAALAYVAFCSWAATKAERWWHPFAAVGCVLAIAGALMLLISYAIALVTA